MASHHQTEARVANMDPHLRQMLEALGLPVIAPEPEVVAADLARIRAKTLARTIGEGEE